MNRHMRRAAAALALTLLASCSGGSAEGDDGSTNGIGRTLVRVVDAQRQARAEPVAAPDPQAMAAEAMAVNPGPLILVGLEQLGATQVLALTGENRGMRTYMTKTEESLIMRDFMLTGTRGLGNDLSVAEAEQSAALIAAGRSGSARRVMRYYSGDGLERPLEFTCRIGPGPNEGVMLEDCVGHGISFQNSYLPSGGVSRQWVGPGIGYATVQVLR
ncbi:YjbF family lipoprotein [uncultured Paracoccus sp.]|uniref:YjbF family lipoprotein n=1 Tax=uncultured Paracoccus sp. TaxID=189685 RepID=UPI00261863EE|nr:YjbF family lipoprotein [uncultured Paracoccus sp.]